MSKKKILIFLVLSIIIVTSLFIYKEYNKPHINVAKATPKIVINSQQILKEYQENENKANTKYLDQIVQISGKVSKLEATNDNRIIITLKNDDKSAISTVICHLTSEENNKLKKLKEGQNIIVKGICTGYLMDIILIRCVLVKI
ncbi:putative nucleic acid binding protein [Tenacibaculum adriaticum]|uniref:Putative nucleic acid binding protein n=1 Tax=Tenacibaculum adriaticum TaxID=413713 RepID=A0A5S5DTM0_9FLAO|nr:hypothetical protein [Tenacibaculum adriaticum]TYP99290.1 putative nucleic acid binding protein [Tenacibaculum adriaticum]